MVTPAMTITPARNMAPVLMFANGVWTVANSDVCRRKRMAIVIGGNK